MLENALELVGAGRDCLDDKIVEAVNRLVFNLFRERQHDSAEEKFRRRD